MTSPLSERALVRAASTGDAQAFRTLYRRHTGAMVRSALGLLGGRDADAEDAVHESWRRMLSALGRFEHRSAFRTWAIGFTIRCCLEQIRRTERFDRVVDEVGAPGGGARSSFAPVDGARVDLERALESMPVGYRTVLLLHDLEGYTHTEIGRLLDLSEGTSKSQLSRARRWLRTRLGSAYARGRSHEDEGVGDE